jgi:hypothetical protein
LYFKIFLEKIMKKLLIGASVAVVALGAAQAQAQVKLDLGGHFKGYGAYVHQDNRSGVQAITNPPSAIDQAQVFGADNRHTDILRETEIHFTGETTLDNGLTVGFHAEADLDNSNDDTDKIIAEESYAYFSGAWGRVNFGKEDGAAFLLQVAAPSADSNVDGIRQYIQPVNYDIIANSTRVVRGNEATAYNQTLRHRSAGGVADFFAGVQTGALAAAGNTNAVNTRGIFENSVLRSANRVDPTTNASGDLRVGVNAAGLKADTTFGYDQAVSGYHNKLTYLTPVFAGFQAGVSYTPELEASTRDVNGVRVDNRDGFGDAWDLAARYEGAYREVGFAIGAGYSYADRRLNQNTATPINPAAPVIFADINANGTYDAGVDAVVAKLDDREAWNVGLDLNFGPFGLGAVYSEDDRGVSGSHFEKETIVVGADYTYAAYKFGVSYLNQEQNFGPGDLDTDRYTAGVQYSYGPGMTFRGSVSYIDHKSNIGLVKDSADATSVLLGTQIDF